MARRTKTPAVKRTPLAEWIAGGIGLILTLSVLGFLFWDAFKGGERQPHLRVEPAGAVATEAGHRVRFRLRNLGPSTAAAVEVTGVLVGREGPLESRRARFDYVPGHGFVEGALIFRRDPRLFELELSADGYADP